MTDWLNGRVTGKTQWNATHFSLTFDAEGPTFIAGQFIRVGMDIDDKRIGRPYSLVNPPHSSEFEIFFNVVPEGPLSHRLAELEIGDPIWLTGSANGFLTLAEVPQTARDLWLLATGTGVGPFLSMLQTGEPWSRFDNIVLGYGVRFSDALGYQSLIEELQRDHPEKFRFVPFVTGEDGAGAIRGRIPEALGDGRLEQAADLKLDANRSHVMLCGHSEMISDVVGLLEERGMRRHRRREPGQISTEKYH